MYYTDISNLSKIIRKQRDIIETSYPHIHENYIRDTINVNDYLVVIPKYMAHEYVYKDTSTATETHKLKYNNSRIVQVTEILADKIIIKRNVMNTYGNYIAEKPGEELNMFWNITKYNLVNAIYNVKDINLADKTFKYTIPMTVNTYTHSYLDTIYNGKLNYSVTVPDGLTKIDDDSTYDNGISFMTNMRMREIID